MHLGIDFGTTRTVVAVSDRGNYPVLTFFDSAGNGWDWFPSVLAEKDGELRFGFAALDVATSPGWTLQRSFKRLLTQPELSPGQTVRLGGSEHTLGDVLTGYLAALRHAIATQSNKPEGGELSTFHALVATPANALGPQRFLTLDAFRRAGFVVHGLLNEPSAAGFEYSHRYRKTLTEKREQVLVYDLGGGTFDVSLVRMRGAHHDVVATGGVGTLGGDDFDQVLLTLALDELGLPKDSLTPAQLGGLLDRARDAKEKLNANSRRVHVDLAGLELGEDEVTLTTGDYFDACLPLVDRTVEALEGVLAAAQESTTSDELAGVYVVGGASALPVVARRLEESFGRRVHRSPYPSAAIAMGLAIAADQDAGFQLTDRLSRYFGVFRERDGGKDVAFDPIFGREERVPARGAERRRIRRVYRAAHNLGHYRFVEANELDARGLPHERLRTCGDFTFPFDPALRATSLDLKGVPVRRLERAGPLVQEEYSVSDLGLVEVSLKDLETGFERIFTLGA